MPVLAQALLALMRGHLMTLALLSTGQFNISLLIGPSKDRLDKIYQEIKIQWGIFSGDNSSMRARNSLAGTNTAVGRSGKSISRKPSGVRK